MAAPDPFPPGTIFLSETQYISVPGLHFGPAPTAANAYEAASANFGTFVIPSAGPAPYETVKVQPGADPVGGSIGHWEPEYSMVAHSLGFTMSELKMLVYANDEGVPFSVIAYLIEQHPPVYHRMRYTTQRLLEEQQWCQLVKTTVAAFHGRDPVTPSAPVTE